MKAFRPLMLSLSLSLLSFPLSLAARLLSPPTLAAVGPFDVGEALIFRSLVRTFRFLLGLMALVDRKRCKRNDDDGSEDNVGDGPRKPS